MSDGPVFRTVFVGDDELEDTQPGLGKRMRSSDVQDVPRWGQDLQAQVESIDKKLDGVIVMVTAKMTGAQKATRLAQLLGVALATLATSYAPGLKGPILEFLKLLAGG